MKTTFTKVNAIFLKVIMFVALIGLGVKGWGQTTQTWTGTTSGAWLTTTNWSASVTPSGTDIALFNNNTQPTVGINMTTLAGVLSLSAFNFGTSATTARTINNSTGTTGVITLSGATLNTIPNTIIWNQSTATHVITNGASTLGIALGNSTNNSINIDGTGGITISSIISGTGNLTKTGTGTGVLTLSNDNTYTGTTTITTGTLQIGAGGTTGLINTSSAITNNAVLTFNRTDNYGQSYSQVISGTGSLNIIGIGGILTLTGSNTYTGLTTVTAGTLQLNKSGGTTIPNTNNVTCNGGTLRISSNQTIANLNISSGGLTVDAGVTLTITGTYNVTGGTINNLGTINLNSSSATSFPGTGVTVNNGTANTISGLIISGTGIVTLGTSITVAGTLTVNQNSTFIIAAGLTNSGGSSIAGTIRLDPSTFVTGTLTYTNTSTLIYNNGNSFTNGNEWNGSGTTAGAGVPQNVIVQNPGTIVVLVGARGLGGALTVNTGCTLIAASGTLSLAGGNNANINGSFQLNSGGFASGGTWNYGTAGTLIFNVAYTVDNNHAYWPTTNGPINVTVLSPGALTIGNGSACNRTVAGVFQTGNGVNLNNGSVLTLIGTCQINANGSFNQAPTYGASATLVYNTGNTAASPYGTNNELPAVNGPLSIILQGNTFINLLSNRTINGNLTINSGSGIRGSNFTLTMAGGTAGTPTIITNSGTMFGEYSGATLNLIFGGYTQIAGSTGYIDARNITISSTLDAGTQGIQSNTNPGNFGSITLTGTLRTSNANGLYDGANTNPTIRWFNNNYGTISLTGGTVEYYSAGAQVVTNAVNYGNLLISTSGTKTLAGNTTATGNFTAIGTAVLVGTGNTFTVGGNWNVSTAGGYVGGTNAASIVTLNGSGARTFVHTGGATFRNLNISGTGTYTSSNDITISVNTLNISNGGLDMGTNSLNGSGLLTMSGGTLSLAKLSTTLPELTGTFSLTGGTIVLNGAGSQTLLGSRAYTNLTFSTSGTKTVTSAPTSITGTVTVAGSAILDVANNSFGGSGTNLTMTGTSTYKTAGTGTKPDAQGTYSLGAGTSIEFTNNVATEEVIRLSPSYYNIIVSGSSVANSSLTSTPLNIQINGSFTVTSTGTFKHANINGFSGASNTTISTTNNPTITLATGSTIEYYRADGTTQNISNNTNVGLGSSHYYNLILSGTGTKTSPSTTLSILGNFTKTTASTFAHNNGTVSFDGTVATAQSYNSVAPNMEFYNLIVNNANGGLSMASDLGVNNILTFNSASKLVFGAGNISIRSTATGTASVAAVPANVSITYPSTGNFYFERFFINPRRWQFLSVPAYNTTATVRDSWMEGALNGSSNPVPGYGMIVTDYAGTGAGFDFTSYSPSVKYYDAASITSYTGIASPSHIIDSKPAYFAYVRGDRTSLPSPIIYTNTTLRTKGQLKRNLQSSYSLAAGQLQDVGNPFPSRIDLRSILTSASLSTATVSVWDTRLGTYLGQFQTLYYDGTDWRISPGGGSYGVLNSIMNTIESGQAFFVKASTSTLNVAVVEAAKVAGSSPTVFLTGGSDNPSQLFARLLLQDSNGNGTVVDGTLVHFDDAYSNNVNNDDAPKITNASENVSVKRNGQLLAIDRHFTPSNNDTIQLSVSNLRICNYQWRLCANNLDAVGRTAYFIDKYLQTSTQLNLSDSTLINFSIINNAGSYAADRFMIVFKQLPTTNFTSITATRNTDKTATVNWAVQNEVSIAKYIVEQSNDGINFNKVVITKLPTANNNTNVNYHTVDSGASKNANWYRVKYTTQSVQEKYTPVAMVSALKEAQVNIESSITVAPNLVQDGVVRVRFENMPTDNYRIQITNSIGQLIKTEMVKLQNAMQVYNLPVGSLAKGIYKAIVFDEVGNKKVIPFEVR